MSIACKTYINHIWTLKPLGSALISTWWREELSDGLSISVLHSKDQNLGGAFQVWVLILLTWICPYPFINGAKLSYAKAHSAYSMSHLARISQPQYYWYIGLDNSLSGWGEAEGGRPVHYRILSSISAFSLLDANSTRSPGFDNQNVSILSNAPGKQNHPWLRILALRRCPIHLSYFFTIPCTCLYSSNMVVFSSSNGPSSFLSLRHLCPVLCLFVSLTLFFPLPTTPISGAIPQDF